MEDKIKLYFDTVMVLIEESGNLIRKRIWETKNVDTKSSPIDFVTETDRQVEEILIEGLKKKFPDHKFIGEESTNESNRPKFTNDPTWIIDPVDGTLNFVHGNPCVSISVALYIDREPVIGIISVPVLKQSFTAIKGSGAFLDGKQIKVSGEKHLKNALLYIEGGSSQDPEKIKTVKENFCNLMPKIHGYRTSGSCAINMANVALGGCDAYFEFGPHIWDFAAGALIVTEAGGVIIDPSGGKFDIMSCRMMCASSNELAQELAKELKQFYPRRDDE